MAENKRTQRTETVSRDRIANPNGAIERHVNQIEFHNTRISDGTFAMKTYIESLIDYAGQDGFPTSLHFYVTKNENHKLTDSNRVTELTIPIIPVLWNITSRESMNSFIKNSKSPEVVSANYQAMDPAEKERRIAQYTQKVMTYITTQLALRYLLAKKHGDKIIMKQIASMSIMKEQGFDFDLFEAIANNPKTLRRKKDGAYLVFDSATGEDLVLISDEQADKYAGYKDSLDKFGIIEKQFTTLNNDLETFRTYDISESKTNQTIGGHSLKNTMRGGTVVAVKPSQPGEE